MVNVLAAVTPDPNLVVFVDFVKHNGLWLMIGFIAFTAIAFSSVKEIVKTRARERSRREIAAYIAEGSMTPEQGERLMRAGAHSSGA